MHRIDTSTAQKDKFGAGKNGFTRGNPQTGTPATDLDDDYFDSIQEELAGIVEASGAALDKSKRNQVLTAMRALLLSREHPFADIKADGAAAVAEALLNLGLTALGIGGAGQILSSLDWQTFDFVPGSSYAVRIGNMTNTPAGVVVPSNTSIVCTISVEAYDTTVRHLVVGFSIGSSADFRRYILRQVGNAGSRAWAVRQIWTSSDTIPISAGGTGSPTVAGAIENLQLRESFSGIVGQSRNARMSVTSASSSATFTSDELIVETSSGQQYRLKAFNKTINIGTTGAGGMDTGSVPATGFIALYAILNPTNGATALLAVNATTATAPEIYGGTSLPAGYTASALVSVWRVASSQLTVGEMIGRQINTPEQPLITVTNTVSTLTELSVSSVIPKNAKTMEGWGLINSTAAATNNSFGVSSKPYPLGFRTQGNNNSGVSAVFSNLMIAEPQKIYYQVGFGGTPTASTIYSTGYSF